MSFNNPTQSRKKNQNGRNVANGYLIGVICEIGGLQEARCQRSQEVVGEVKEKEWGIR